LRAFVLLAQAMQLQQVLLFDGLDRHGPHGLTPARLEQGRRIGGVGLAAMHVGPYILSWQQSNLVSPAREGARPVMGRAAGLHQKEARR